MNDDLLDRIYEASAFPERWPDSLEQIARRVGALGGNLIRNTGSHFIVNSSRSVAGISKEFDRLGWNSDNSRVKRLIARSPYPGFLTDLDLHTMEEIRTLPMYTQFLTPRGADAGAATIIQGFSNDMLAIAFEAFQNHDAAFAAVPTLNSLRPHLARAAALSSQVSAARAASLLQAFETLGTSMALLDINGKIVMATPLFAGEFDRLVTDRTDRLHFVDPIGDERLANALARLRQERLGSSIAVRDRNGMGKSVLHLLPARGDARDLFGNVSIFAVLASPSNRLLPDADILGALFDLTPAEARVARAVALGKRPEDIARSAGISVETVRSQLKRVFSKTSTGHQSELAVLLASFG